MENLIYKHINNGVFQTKMEDGSIKTVGNNTVGMIRYTYFEDYSLPPIGWEVSQKQLMEDYLPKMQKDMMNHKLEISYTDNDGINHYKEQ
jgi:hypothetical protein